MLLLFQCYQIVKPLCFHVFRITFASNYYNMKRFLLSLGLCLALSTQAQIIVPSLSKGIVFESEDNSFKAQLGFRIQNLVTLELPNNRTDLKANALVRRARLKLDGHVFNPKWVYKFEMGLSNRDIGARSDYEQSNSASKMILDAVVKYQAHRNLEIWFGQTKLPGNRERVNSSQKLQFVDRSLVNSYYNIDRDMGVQLHYNTAIKNVPIKAAASMSLGEGRNITGGNYGGFNYTGRVEVLPFGEFTKGGDYFSADLAREQKPKLSIGATYDLNMDASRQGGQLNDFVTDTLGNAFYRDLNTLFVDMIFKYKGFSAMAEYADKKSDSRINDGAINTKLNFRTGTGITFQAGYLFKNNLEVAARYTSISADATSSLTDINEYTLALSKYVVGHTVKVQSDFGISQNPNALNADPIPEIRFQVEVGF